MLALGFGAMLTAACVTFYGVPIMIQVAHRLNILDNPDGRLKVHKSPTPYLGGLAVYFGFISSLALFMPYCSDFVFLVLGLTILVFVGLIDDLIALNPLQKFSGQVVAGLCFLKGGFYLKTQFLATYNSYFLMAIILAVSLLWILAIINSLNLVDVMDGLATSIGLGSALMFCFFAYNLHNTNAFLATASFIGSLAAFLYYNKPRASIYLGDTGSMFIGGFLAALPSMISWGLYDSLGFLTPVMVLFIPLAELGTLIVVRTFKGIPFYLGSPDHFCHYFMRAGWSPAMILLYVAVWDVALLFGAQALMAHAINLKFIVCTAIFSVALWWSMLFLLAKPCFVAFDQIYVMLQRHSLKNPLFIAFRVLRNLMQRQ